MKLSNLPLAMTEYDKKLFDENSKSVNFSNFAYDEKYRPIKLTKYEEESDSFLGLVEVFQGLSFEDENVSGIPRTMELLIPTNYYLFESYKSELKIEPFFVNGQLNKEDKMISHLLSINENIEYSSQTLYVIYEESSMTHTFFDSSNGHPFKTISGFECDSLDLALKSAFEIAVSEKDYNPADTRTRLEKFEAYLDSEEGKESLKQFAEDIDAKRKRAKDFYESEQFNELANTSIPNFLKENEVSGLYCNDYVDYGIQKNHFINETTFFKFVNAAFSELKVKEDMEAIFSTEYVELDKLVVTRVHGQGTVYSIELKQL